MNFEIFEMESSFLGPNCLELCETGQYGCSALCNYPDHEHGWYWERCLNVASNPD